MKTTINLYQFRDAFERANRGTQFSYEGLEVLFDYFEEYKHDTGEEIELDVIAICCEYAEASPKDIADDYSIDLDEDADDEAIAEAVQSYLEDEGVYIGTTDDGSIVYQQF
jgi:predicted ArsR family transcriptional regulator